jgi:CheY-like chemotaxis protein
MGCELSVNSEPGVGTKFRVTLPFAPVPQRADEVAPNDTSPVQDSEKDQLVLIIDDEPDARLLLAEHVRSFGMRPVSAASGPEGLRMARELVPDLVTLDLKMPGMDGWATLRAFKADPKLRNIPVVVVSVIASEARGTFLGHLDLVGKPVNRDALEEAVRRNLRGEASRALVVDDDPDSRLLLTTLLENTVEEVRTAEDGAQALAVLDDFDPGVILLDLVMPRMDGMTFLKTLRGDPRHARTPVLVVTSKELTAVETAVLERTTEGIIRKGPRSDPHGSLRDRLAEFLAASAPYN